MIKRVLALIAIVLLVGMYAVTIVFALIDNPNTLNLLGASIGASVVIPVLLWVAILFFKGREENKKRLEDK